jgi:hypothetical protein
LLFGGVSKAQAGPEEMDDPPTNVEATGYLEPVTKPHKIGNLLIPRLRISNYGKTSCY